MNDGRDWHQDQITAVTRTAQYLAGITSDRAIWAEFAQVLHHFVGADLVVFIVRQPDGTVAARHCNLPDPDDCDRLLTQVQETVHQVVNNGFLSSETVSVFGDAYAVAFLPLVRNKLIDTVLLLGRRSHEPLDKPVLDIYLAAAGLIETTLARLDSERLLGMRAREQAVVAELGQKSLAGLGLDELMDEAVRLVAATLEVEYSKILELLPDGEALLLRAGVGWKAGLVGHSTVSAGLESQAGYTLHCNQPVIVADLRRETRFSGPPLLHDHGVVSGLSVIVRGRERPYGVLGAHTTRRRLFTEDDGHFLQAVANVVGAAIERGRADEEVRRLARRNRLILNSTGAGIYGLDAEGRCTFINPAALNMLGYTAAELAGRSAHEVFHHSRPDGSAYPAVECPVHQAYWQGRTYRGADEVYWRKDGRPIPVEYVSTPIMEDGKLVGAVVSFQDITARKEAEEALRRSNAYNRSLIEASLDPLVTIGPDGKITDVNAATEAVTGRSRQELIGTDFSDYFTEPARARAGYEQVFREGAVRDYELAIRHRDGRITPVLYNASVYRDEHGEVIGVYAVARDITVRKRAVEQLQQYANRLSVLTQLDRVISSTLRIEDMFDVFVREMGRLIAFDRVVISTIDETGQRWKILKQWTAGGAPARQDEEWRAVAGFSIGWLVEHQKPLLERWLGEKGEWSEIEWLRQDGVRSRVMLPLIVKDKPIGALGLGSCREAAYTENDLDILQPLSEQLAIALHNAHLYEQVQSYAAEMERRVAERTAQLETANRELEAFSYSVSHDLRAPLRAVDGFARILLDEYRDKLDEEGRRLLHVIREGAAQMGQMINDILAFSRAGRFELNRSTVDMTALARGVAAELCPLEEGRTVNITVHDLPAAHGDPAMLRQVFANLIGNAVKFTAKKKAALIEVGAQPAERETVYYVRDNGAGFDMRYADRLFGVFQRLHSTEEFEGTGIGLAIVKRIIARHGGRVWAEGKVGKGATFYFTLPTREVGYE